MGSILTAIMEYLSIFATKSPQLHTYETF